MLVVFLLISAGPSAGPAEPAPAAAQAQAQAQATTEALQPKSNTEIRRWYNDQVGVIPALNQTWRAQGLSAEARARRAYEIRHTARNRARRFMADTQEVAALRKLDQAKYGNPDGPTFEYLVEQNRKRGLAGDAVYDTIIGSANRTDPGYNAKFNVTPAGKPP
ncbi:MAG: hypothetical protein GC191_12655 [Azospirillum sp.]|nr:hypothetical protein [Azospirillum sp.]